MLYNTNWTNQSYAERHIGTSSYIDEYVGDKTAKLSIQFVDPGTMGLNKTAWPEQGIWTIVIGKALIGDLSLESFDGTSYLMHRVRRVPNGHRELRPCFFLDANHHGSSELGHDVSVHYTVGMAHLGPFLPPLFQEFKNTV